MCIMYILHICIVYVCLYRSMWSYIYIYISMVMAFLIIRRVLFGFLWISENSTNVGLW